MLLALFSDIHANRQAFAACLEAARTRVREAESVRRRVERALERATDRLGR